LKPRPSTGALTTHLAPRRAASPPGHRRAGFEEGMMSVWPAHVENQVLKDAAAAMSRVELARDVRSLIARYPRVSAEERGAILSYVKRAGYVEMQLLALDETVRRQLGQFLKAHKQQLRYSLGDIATIAAAAVAFFAFCWLLWRSLSGS
jgi:hypothetical protein